jgi:hypothetical protein
MAPHHILVLAALALSCVACTQSPPPDPARRATIPAPGEAPGATAAKTVDVTKPDTLRYTCDDGGALRIAYVAETARVELPGGRVVTLPKAQSASKGGGEVFVGEAMSLQRDGDAIQVHPGGGKSLLCRSSGKGG